MKSLSKTIENLSLLEKEEKVKDLLILEEYLLNKHYLVYWKEYNYQYDILYPYFH